MIVSAIPVFEEAAPFTDVEEDTRYTDAIAWGYAEGIIEGVSDNKLAPQGAATRAQVAAGIMRLALLAK